MKILKIRASQAYKMMTEPKLKADKEAGNLSETTKTYIRELFLLHEYSYSDVVISKEMRKGIITEDNSLTLVQDVMGGVLRIKNIRNFQDEFFTGTPDIILPDCIEDVKSCWSPKSFMEADLCINYYIQGQVYMHLTGVHNYRLIYCLNNTPENLITAEKQRYYYMFDCDESNPELIAIYNQIDANHHFDHIAKEKRIKIFDIEYNEEIIEILKNKILKAREYYSNLILNIKL